MNSNDQEVFAAFLRRRAALNERIDTTGREIDAWLGSQRVPPSLQALAALEVMLKERRDVLSELAELDQNLVNHLISMRENPSSKTNSTASCT